MAFNYEKLYLNFLVNYHDFYFANVKMEGYINYFESTTSGKIFYSNTSETQNKSFNGIPKKFRFKNNGYFTIDVSFVF